MRLGRVLCALVLLPLLAGAPGASASCSQSYVVPLALFGDVAARASDGVIEGYLPDLIAELARRTACDLRVDEAPAARIQMMRAQGLVPLLPYTSERAPSEGYRFIPTERFAHDLLVNRARLPAAGTPAAVLADRRIVFGRVRGMNYGKELTAVFNQLGGARIDESSSLDELYRKLVAGHIDAAFQFPLVHDAKLKALKAETRVAVLPFEGAPPQVVGWTVLSPPMRTDDALLIEAAIRGMYADGTTTRILARYLGEANARRARFAAAEGKSR